MPSIHVISKKHDPFYDESMRMVAMHTSPQHTPHTFFHDEGHKFPNVKHQAHLYREVGNTILAVCHALKSQL